MVAVRWVRVGVAAVLTALILSACATGTGATLLVVSPGSIRAGYQIAIHATCGENLNPAYVSSRAFGSITLQPDHGLLRTEVTIPGDTGTGTYSVNLRCASGGHSSAKLTVLDGAYPNQHQGPETGGGEMAASGGARLALFGGLGSLLAGIGLWVVAARRRALARG